MSDNNNLKTCSRCHSTKLESYFGINAKGECYKSCDKCRKKRRDIKEDLKPKPNPEEIKSTERKLEYMRQYLQDNKERLKGYSKATHKWCNRRTMQSCLNVYLLASMGLSY